MAEIAWPWQYNFPPFFTEGNAHIVLQLKETEHVLRLIKEDEEHTKNVNPVNTHNSVKFVNHVMIPLLSIKSNNCLELIELPDSALSSLRGLQDLRPKHRRFKSKLGRIALRTRNLAILSLKCETNYCVEIKPKEGFLTRSLQPLSKCYYCLKQLLKLYTNEIQQRSYYCPLDLFSGEIKRMQRALINLISNPQNNFKMFEDGKVIYDDKSGPDDFNNILKNMRVFENANVFIDFLIQILLSKDNLHTTPTKSEEIKIQPTTVSKCLQSSTLQSFDSSFFFKLLDIQKLSELKEVDLNSATEEHTNYVQEMLDDIKKRKLDLNLELDRKEYLKTAPSIHLAMISAVAKDCSVMISFSPDYVDGHEFITIGNKKIPYNVSMTDLEPKNVMSLSKRQKTEGKIMDIYKEYLKNEREINKLCKIQPHTETRAKQLEAWQQLIAEYFKANKLSTLDIREAQNYPLFNNPAINRKLSQESVLTVLEDMARVGRASPLDKSKTVWEVYWHSLDEWGNMVYSWASNNGMNNSVCTLFELREGENTVDEEFHGLDMNILTKALKTLEAKGRCELMEFDDNQGVKFF